MPPPLQDGPHGLGCVESDEGTTRDGGNVVMNGYSVREHGNIGSNTESQEDLLAEMSSHRNHKNLKKNIGYLESQSLSDESRNIMDSYPYQNGMDEFPSSSEGCVGAAQSFATPEKLILEPDLDIRAQTSYGVASSWMSQFPQGSRTVTVPRGDKGFGFIMVEKKVR